MPTHNHSLRHTLSGVPDTSWCVIVDYVWSLCSLLFPRGTPRTKRDLTPQADSVTSVDRMSSSCAHEVSVVRPESRWRAHSHPKTGSARTPIVVSAGWTSFGPRSCPSDPLTGCLTGSGGFLGVCCGGIGVDWAESCREVRQRSSHRGCPCCPNGGCWVPW
jgi:hypothetical protein